MGVSRQTYSRYVTMQTVSQFTRGYTRHKSSPLMRKVGFTALAAGANELKSSQLNRVELRG